MWRTVRFWTIAFFIAAIACRAHANEAVTSTSPPSATPGAAQISIAPASSPIVLRGCDARRQLIVTSTSNGTARDVTRAVQFAWDPPGVVAVDAAGVVSPLADGSAMVTAKVADGATASIAVQVTHMVDEAPISFPNQIVPVFTKLACNSGGCHGKAAGQNGFKLSLLGFEPAEDYEHLVKEARGRRVFPAAPDRSLLLLKPINATPHGGGQRMDSDSADYRLLRRWIAQGMPYGSPDDPRVECLEVIPANRVLSLQEEQQIAVLAHYTDGAVEDVTRLAQYDPNDAEMAEVSAAGLVRMHDLTGDVAIMARYQGHVATFRATAPLGAPTDNMPASANFIDELVFHKLRTLGVPASPMCDDPTFLRRVTIDIAGRLPTLAETKAFLTDSDPSKRSRAIDRLLDSEGYADNFATKWNAILRNKTETGAENRGAYAFHGWIRDAMRNNMPYDQFAEAIVAASGEVGAHPPVAWYRQAKTTEQQVEDAAQLFLGMRMQCARCHHHPYEKWSQRDYYSLAAFFSQVRRKPGLQHAEERIYHLRGPALAKHPKSGEMLPPAGLDAAPAEITADDDPRLALVDWMRSVDNPYFAPAIVNRYWKHFFARGLIEPEDDMRVTNPASNPALVDALADQFVETGFDLKELARTICNSTAYQLSAEPVGSSRVDLQACKLEYSIVSPK